MYAFTLFRHCGIGTVPFGGRMWKSGDAVPTPEPDASGIVTENGSTDGTMRLVAADRLEFTYRAQPTSPPRTLVFTPTTATQQPCA